MTNQFSLDDIRAAAEKKYGNVTINFGEGDSVSLINPLRLRKERRDELIKLQDRLDRALQDGHEDQADLLAGGIRLVSSDESAADRLLANIDGDLAILAQVFTSYTEGTQAGEA